MIKPKAIVICGDGINCDAETAFALEQAGFDPLRLHTSAFLEHPGQLFEAQLLAIPGGFSFGDEIASGKVLAIKVKRRVRELLYEYIDAGHLVLGICNGFQVLVQLGLLPFADAGAPRVVSLTRNAEGKFINRWVELDVEDPARSPFFAGLSHIHLPIRHGEGRVTVPHNMDKPTADKIAGHIALRYSININGSYERIAALTNSQGNVLGLMPHPEAFVRWTQHPAWSFWERSGCDPAKRHPRYPAGVPDGLAVLKNAYDSLS